MAGIRIPRHRPPAWIAGIVIALAVGVAGTASASAATIEYRPSDFTSAFVLTTAGKEYGGTEFRDFTDKRVRRDVRYGHEVVSTFNFYDKLKTYTYDSLFNSCETASMPAGTTMSADVTDLAGRPVTNFVSEGTLEVGGEVLERWVGSSAEGPIVVGTGVPPGLGADSTPIFIEYPGEEIFYEGFVPGQPDASSFNLPARCAGSGAPSAVIVTPAREALYGLGQTVAADFTCEGGTGEEDEHLKPGDEGCVGTVPEGGSLDTSTLGTHTFSVTATEVGGETWTSTRSYKVAGPPTATISSPASGAIYEQGKSVGAIYHCAEGAEGTKVESCTGTVPYAASIDTSTLGEHTFTVTAKSTDGLTGHTQVTYEVTAPVGGSPSKGPSTGGPINVGPVRVTYSPNHPHARGHGPPRYTFRFSGEPGVSFLCHLGAAPFRACSSPMVYRGLKRGTHVFGVKATGASGASSPVSTVPFTAGRRQAGALPSSG